MIPLFSIVCGSLAFMVISLTAYNLVLLEKHKKALMKERHAYYNKGLNDALALFAKSMSQAKPMFPDILDNYPNGG